MSPRSDTIRLNRFDTWLLVFLAAVIGFIMLMDEVQFEMTTDHPSRNVNITTAILSVLLCGYFLIKYVGFKRFQFYVLMIFFSLASWTLISIAGLSTLMLLHHMITPTKTVNLPITYVYKRMSKSSFTGSQIWVIYNGQKIIFRSSRTNYFALVNKTSMKVDLGCLDHDNYYVTKLYLSPAEFNAARHQYWQNWRQRSRSWLYIIGGLLLLVICTLLFGKHKIGQDKKDPVKKVSVANFIKIWLIIMGAVFMLFMLFLGYLYLRYGFRR